jgi:hypothetical protein
MTYSPGVVAVHGPDEYPAFPDELHDVPLRNSLAASAPGPGSDSNSPKSLRSDGTPSGPAASIFPKPQRQAVLTVCVHSPENATESTLGILQVPHTVFTVETKSSLKAFPKAYCAVKRRFSDFTALYEALHFKFAGYFVPPCPHKDLLQGKVMPSKVFLARRAQGLEIFVGRCCDHPILQASKVLMLFLTLNISGSGPSSRLTSHPDWKHVQAEEPLFRCFQLVRSLQPLNNDAMPTPVIASAPTTIASIGHNLLKGIHSFGKRIHSSVLVTPHSGATEDSICDSVTSEALAFGERTAKYTELLRLWTIVATRAENMSTSLEGLREAFDHLSVHESTALTSLMLVHADCCQRQAVNSRNVAEAGQQTSHCLSTFAKVSDAVVLPWQHSEASLQAAHDACSECSAICKAQSELGKQVQKKRELQRVLAPGTSESVTRSHGLEEIQRGIRFLEEQIEGMSMDYRTVRGAIGDEIHAMKGELRVMGPLAALQVAVSEQSLCEDLTRHWEALAHALGAV